MNEHDIDKVLRQIAADASLDEASVDKIAGSKELWWSVRREVRAGSSPWPPSIFRRWLVIGASVAAAAVILLVFTGQRPSVVETAKTDEAISIPSIASAPSLIESPDEPAAPEVSQKTMKPRTRSVAMAKRGSIRPGASTPGSNGTVRSEFVALTYARDPESGQLLRVKVPSSMMVSLGLLSHVDQPSALVDAEVIVGDDGLTHAIRFIRQ